MKRDDPLLEAFGIFGSLATFAVALLSFAALVGTGPDSRRARCAGGDRKRRAEWNPALAIRPHEPAGRRRRRRHRRL